MKRFTGLFILIFFITYKIDTNTDDSRVAFTQTDIAYGSDSRQTMDIYLPAASLILIQATGNTPDTNPAPYRQSSLSTFVTPQSPPTMFMHRGADTLVTPAQAELLKIALSKVCFQSYVFI